jgi:hypothetical protein
LNAARYAGRPNEVPLPRPREEVPQDLLTPQEREVNRYFCPAWIRTDYNPGTDEKHKKLLDDIDRSLEEIFDQDEPVLDDPSRYDTSDVEALLAFVPVMLEFAGAFYEQDEVAWDSEDLQQDFLDVPEAGDSDEILKEKRMIHQRYFYIADQQAMTFGLILWVHVDEFGEVLQRNRVRPGDLITIRGYKASGLSLDEMGVGYQDGRAFAPKTRRGPMLRRRVPALQ